MRIIKQRVSSKMGRSIIGPVLPRLAVNGSHKSSGLQEKRARVICFSCGREIGLDQEMSGYHSGLAKCSSCSAMSRTGMENAILETNAPIKLLLDPPIEYSCRGSVISQENKRT